MHNAVHVIKQVLVQSENVMQSNCMPFQHPQDAISEWSKTLHNVIDDGPFILCCAQWLVITVLGLIEQCGVNARNW